MLMRLITGSRCHIHTFSLLFLLLAISIIAARRFQLFFAYLLWCFRYAFFAFSLMLFAAFATPDIISSPLFRWLFHYATIIDSAIMIFSLMLMLLLITLRMPWYAIIFFICFRWCLRWYYAATTWHAPHHVTSSSFTSLRHSRHYVAMPLMAAAFADAAISLLSAATHAAIAHHPAHAATPCHAYAERHYLLSHWYNATVIYRLRLLMFSLPCRYAAMLMLPTYRVTFRHVTLMPAVSLRYYAAITMPYAIAFLSILSFSPFFRHIFFATLRHFFMLPPYFRLPPYVTLITRYFHVFIYTLFLTMLFFDDSVIYAAYYYYFAVDADTTPFFITPAVFTLFRCFRSCFFATPLLMALFTLFAVSLAA